MKNKLTNRIGMKKQNNNGSNMTIIEYDNCQNIIVEFDNNYKTKTTFFDFMRGKVRNVYEKTFYNIGYIGEGKYNLTYNRQLTPSGEVWHSMLTRCYNNKFLNKNTTYKDCIMCEEWHNFQNFAKWHEENYYQIENEKMDLDKDILIKGNKIYSPETCIFVPHIINMLFTDSKNKENNLPKGVRIIKRPKPYNTRYNGIHLGCFNTLVEAFEAYKTFKEEHIKEIANKFKDQIPEKLYNALYNYKVEITD
jgi:hypothetical protein